MALLSLHSFLQLSFNRLLQNTLPHGFALLAWGINILSMPLQIDNRISIRWTISVCPPKPLNPPGTATDSHACTSGGNLLTLATTAPVS
jgi:hypothetical protein